ncbi:MAG TPA: hypothetical protein DCL35_02395 [Candidatus Omnitrophica bacterium]|nr:hypothetical protein [Candidatus Omnitrophota bacterium]
MKSDVCVDYSGIKIKGGRASGLCPQGLDTRDAVSVFDFVPKNFCPLAFHSIYPYLLAFTHNARLEWLHDRTCVEAQCPNPDSAVVMRLKKKDKINKIYDIEIIGLKADCPYGMREGVTFLNISLSQNICLRAFDAIMPYLNELARPSMHDKNSCAAALKATCPGCSYSREGNGFSSVVFTIKREVV